MPPVVAPPLGGWLSLDRVAELTGEPLRTLQHRAARQWAARGLAELRPPAGGKGKACWWVAEVADPRLCRVSRPVGTDHPDERTRESLLASHPEHAVKRAYLKAHWLHRWRRACDTAAPGDTEISIARRIVAEAKRADDGLRISIRSLQAWHAAHRRGGIAALVDKYTVGSAVRTKDTVGRAQPAVDYFYSLYHTTQRLGIKLCHQYTVREARRNGWQWPAAYTATTRWLRATDDLSLTCLMRDGKDAWCRRYMPHNEIDYSLIGPGQLYQTDHHQCDFWVEHEGKQLRPWLTAVEDLSSRAIVGWHLGPVPHQDAIIAAYLMAFRDWSVPERLRIDNGKDYASELLTGVTKATRDRLRVEYGRDWVKVLKRDAHLIDCVDPRFMGITAELGIETIYAIPYAPWSKGQTERWFGTFEGRCGKTMATYCGNSTLARPECLEQIRRGYTRQEKYRLRKKHGREWKKIVVLKLTDASAVPTMAQARQAVADYILDYHNTAHSADDMAGRTPLEAWATATGLRRADDQALLFMMQARGVFKVGGNGVSFKVGGVTMHYGASAACLQRWHGRDVFVSIDPTCLDHCYAFTPERDSRRLIGRLEANKRISPMASVDELREANAAVGRRRKRMHQAHRDAARRTRTAAEELAAQRRRRAAELRATGTDDAQATPNIAVVRTGFEAVSIPDRTTFKPGPSEYDDVDVDALDFTAHRCDEPEEQLADDPDDPYADIDVDTLNLSHGDSETDQDAADPYAAIDIDDLTFPDAEGDL